MAGAALLSPIETRGNHCSSTDKKVAFLYALTTGGGEGGGEEGSPVVGKSGELLQRQSGHFWHLPSQYKKLIPSLSSPGFHTST